MSYIGKAPGFGIRNRYYYTATATQTLFSGADDNGQTLAYADSKYLDVYLNGVLLVAGTDYTATTLTSVTLTSGAAADDIIEIVAYDIFSVADTVSAANGGTFNGAVTVDDTLTASGLVTAQDGLVVDNDGATVATFDRATSDGTIVDLQKDGSTVGSIGTESSDVYIESSASNHSGLRFGASVIWPRNNGSLTNNVVDLGANGTAFKDLYLSGGVYLGGTGSANKLDDYEEGTWTPTVNFTTPGNLSVSYTIRRGSYRKIGNLVHINGHILTSAFTHSTASGLFLISDLPFAAHNTNENYFNGSVTLGSWNYGSGYSYIVTNLDPTYRSTDLYIQVSGQNVPQANLTTSSLPSGNNITIRFEITYYTT